ncbi:MAG: uncharacterized protein KVP18_002377 [Porospora cf. gigantea A]|uniref:uncharacterized protein n=1 Tax=Porospora cf. gigantea A TaxID=2853593 RepID=UPI003559F35D|nr:MAG: hypothetical protein KVP18_002377 [Porospora cf. gigantea A]
MPLYKKVLNAPLTKTSYQQLQKVLLSTQYHNEAHACLAITADTLYSGSSLGIVWTWDLLLEFPRPLTVSDYPITSLVLAPECFAMDSSGQVFALGETARPVVSVRPGGWARMVRLDDGILAMPVMENQPSLSLVDPRTGMPVSSWELRGLVSSVASRNSLVVCGGLEGGVVTIDVRKGPLRLEPGNGMVTALAFDTEGRLAHSALNDVIIDGSHMFSCDDPVECLCWNGDRLFLGSDNSVLCLNSGKTTAVRGPRFMVDWAQGVMVGCSDSTIHACT